MMSIFFGAEFVGYLTPIPLITMHNQLNVASPIFYLIFGGAFVIFSLLEVFTFNYMPSSLGIKID